MLQFLIPASAYERFSPEAAKGMVGKSFTAKIEDAPIGEGVVLSARVVHDGEAIEVMVEWPDNVPSS
jgi:hypothetical protein